MTIDYDKPIEPEKGAALVLLKLYSGKITNLKVDPAEYVISDNDEQSGAKSVSRVFVERAGHVLKTTITGPPPLFNTNRRESPSCYNSIRLPETTRGTLLDPTVSNVIGLNHDLGYEVPSNVQSQIKMFQSHESIASLDMPSSFFQENVDPVFVAECHEHLMYALTDKQNAMALTGSGINEATGAFTVAASHAGDQNRIEIPAGDNPEADASPNLDYLTEGLDKANSGSSQTRKCSIHLSNTFAQTLKRNTLEEDYPVSKHKINEIMLRESPRLGAIYTHLGYPVFNAPSLASSLEAKAELGVGGDFSNFWVVMRPIYISVYPHPDKRDYMRIQVSQGMDSDLVDFFHDGEKPCPLFYIEGSDN